MNYLSSVIEIWREHEIQSFNSGPSTVTLTILGVWGGGWGGGGGGMT